MAGMTPTDNARIVGLEVLLGNRGSAGDRALRVKEAEPLIQAAIGKAIGGKAQREKQEALAADTSLPTAGAWVAGPSLTLEKGVWQINASVLVRSDIDGAVAARLFNGSDTIAATQASHPATAGHFTALSIATHIVMPATGTITLQAAPSVTSATIEMMAETSVGGALTATRLSAVQIGA